MCRRVTTWLASFLGLSLLIAPAVILPSSAARTDPLALFGSPPAQAPASRCPRAGVRTAEDCGACHEADPEFSHPVGVAPPMPVPSYLPLEGGRITCLTCHDTSPLEADSAVWNTQVGARRSPGRGLCASCHVAGENARRAMHGAATGRAHLRWRRGGSSGLGRATAGERAARYSRDCLSCHDGSIAFDAKIVSFGGRIRAGEHPVDVSYATSVARAGRVGRTLAPISTLDPRLRLRGDRVGCETCHSPYSTLDHLLVMSNQGSRLCLSCHRI